MKEDRGVTPVEPPVDEDEEEEEGTRTTARPVDPGKVDASEGQQPVDDWADDHRSGHR